MSISLRMVHTVLSALSTRWEVFPMGNMKIRKIWDCSYQDNCSSGHFQSDAQLKAPQTILNWARRQYLTVPGLRIFRIPQ